MQFLHHAFAFELSNEWWAEADMNGFIPTAVRTVLTRKRFLVKLSMRCELMKCHQSRENSVMEFSITILRKVSQPKIAF